MSDTSVRSSLVNVNDVLTIFMLGYGTDKAFARHGDNPGGSIDDLDPREAA